MKCLEFEFLGETTCLVWRLLHENSKKVPSNSCESFYLRHVRTGRAPCSSNEVSFFFLRIFFVLYFSVFMSEIECDLYQYFKIMHYPDHQKLTMKDGCLVVSQAYCSSSVDLAQYACGCVQLYSYIHFL